MTSSRLVAVIAGLLAVAAASPALICLADALVPLILVAGVVLAVLRVVWSLTRRW